jgi:nucleoside-diphosphate-sugar epimerase
VRRFVVAASSSAYGDTPELPKRENMPANPFSPYAVSKLAQEQYCRAFAVSYGMQTVSLRYFNVYGPRQDPSSQYAAVVPKFFHAFLRGESPTIYGDGEQTRDFTFVADVVDANLKAGELANAEGQIFNIAGGRRVVINELAQIIRSLTGAQASPKHVAARKGDIRHSLADITRAREQLRWGPSTTLESGLEICAGWYRAHR